MKKQANQSQLKQPVRLKRGETYDLHIDPITEEVTVIPRPRMAKRIGYYLAKMFDGCVMITLAAVLVYVASQLI